MGRQPQTVNMSSAETSAAPRLSEHLLQNKVDPRSDTKAYQNYWASKTSSGHSSAYKASEYSLDPHVWTKYNDEDEESVIQPTHTPHSSDLSDKSIDPKLHSQYKESNLAECVSQQPNEVLVMEEPHQDE